MPFGILRWPVFGNWIDLHVSLSEEKGKPILCVLVLGVAKPRRTASFVLFILKGLSEDLA